MIFIEYIKNNLSNAEIEKRVEEINASKKTGKKTTKKSTTVSKGRKAITSDFVLTEAMYQALLNRIEKLERIIQFEANSLQSKAGIPKLPAT